MNTPTRRPPVVTPLAPVVITLAVVAVLVIAAAIVVCIVLDVPAWTVGGLLAAGVGHVVTLLGSRRRRARARALPDELDASAAWPQPAMASDAPVERFARPHTIIPK